MVEEFNQYDLVVIGSGSGQNVAAAAASQLNWKVAVIEKGPMGGTCLNRGCIPSKMIIQAADVAETIRKAKKFGIDASINSIDFSTITQHATRYVAKDAAGIEKGTRQSKNIDLYKGIGEFVPHENESTSGFLTLRVKKILGGEERVVGKKVLIAAGARPNIPPIKGIKDVDYWTSTEALRAQKQPESLTIIGGGYVAAELGHFYGALGTKVTIVEHGERLINHEDFDVSSEFTRVFSDKYKVLLNTTAEAVVDKDDGTKELTVSSPNGGEKKIRSEKLLIATGITPNSETLRVKDVGVETDSRGYVQVDEFMQTNVPGIYALGDITGIAPFKHAANYQARIVFYNLAAGENKYKADNDIIPRAIFSSPQVAAVGITQQEAEKQGLEFRISKLGFDQTAMGGAAMQEENAFVKFILDPKGLEILGCHIMGPQASVLIQEVVVAMTAAEGKVSAIKDSIHIHPALSEVISKAL